MTPEQRYDLAIEWRLTNFKLRQTITEEYQRKYGREQSREHWEEYLIEALNLKRFWQTAGLI